MHEQPKQAPDADWLDGLQGRAGMGSAHADGQALREALREGLQHDETPPLSWEALKARSVPMAASPPVTALGAALAGRGRLAAANGPRWVLVACLALAGLAAMWQGLRTSETEALAPALRGTAGQPTVWHDADPAAAASTWAERLRESGLQVTESTEGPCQRLDAVSVAAERDQAVLLSWDLALDAQGRVTLRICPP